MRNPYIVLKSPLVTEKLQTGTEKGIYGFWVARQANKIEIKNAVEKIYNVRVEKVNVINLRGKKKRLRFREGKTSAWKKALVKLRSGQAITLE